MFEHEHGGHVLDPKVFGFHISTFDYFCWDQASTNEVSAFRIQTIGTHAKYLSQYLWCTTRSRKASFTFSSSSGVLHFRPFGVQQRKSSSQYPIFGRHVKISTSSWLLILLFLIEHRPVFQHQPTSCLEVFSKMS